MRSPLLSHAVVDAWFDTLPPDLCALGRDLQRLLLEVAPSLNQSVKWGNLVFLYRGTHALAIVAHKGHLNLQVFNGALLAPEFAQLAGTGKGMRHLRCRAGVPIDAPLVRALTVSCVEALELRSTSPPPLTDG